MQVVTPILVPVVVTVTSSPNPATVGQSVTFLASVTLASGSAVVGEGLLGFFDGTTLVRIVPVDASGHASITLAAPKAELRTITAIYFGNATFGQARGSIVETVNPAVPFGAPSVAKFQRFGFHLLPTTLVLTFTSPLDPFSASNPNNYRITDTKGRPIAVLSATYDPIANTVTLKPAHRLDIHSIYHLRVLGTGPGALKELDGKLFAGAGSPGTDYRSPINRSILVLPANYMDKNLYPISVHAVAHPKGPAVVAHHSQSVKHASAHPKK